MMRRISTRLLVALLAIGLTVSACVDEEEEGEGETASASPEDIEAPLEDTAGAWYEDAPPNEELPEVAKADEQFPAQFDLVDVQSPVSDQQRRGICSVFSTVGLMEHLYIINEDLPAPQFSEQYLQWSAKKEVGRFTTSSGSTAQVNLQAISNYGIVEEDYWPYEGRPWGENDHEACDGSDDQPTICYTNGNPPEEAQEAPTWSLPRGSWISTRVRDIKSHMKNEGQAVIVGGDFFYQAWNHGGSELPTSDEYWSQGYVPYPNETDKEKSLADRVGHSFLLVGWEDDLEVHRLDEDGEPKYDDNGEPVIDRGFFIFKNSWGTGSFGVDNPYGDGYGFISYDHVENHLRGRVSDIPTEAHVPSDVLDEELECTGHELECGNQCVPIDASNCGECGNVCDDGYVCTDRQCQLPEGEQFIYAFDGDPIEIPDYDPDAGEPGEAVAELDVEDSGLIQDLSLDVDIEHTYRGDIQIELVHPDGHEVLVREADGQWGRDIEESYNLGEFNELDVQGTWQLVVSDHAYHDVGTLQSWALEVVH